MEEVLVIPAELVFAARDNDGDFIARALKQYRFMPRDAAEGDPRFKQIIPYVAARYGNAWFVMKRLSAQSERRLHGKLSLGIGGHINPADTGGGDVILAGMNRELSEEVRLDPAGQPVFRGIINDDSTAVGRVHVGLVYELACASPSFEIMEKDKISGEWADPGRIAAEYDAFESWSQIVINRYIRNR